MKSAGMSQGLDLVSDIYTLYPIHTQVSINARVHDQYDNNNVEWTNVINQSKSFGLPDFETFKQLLEDKKLPFIPLHICLNDRRSVDEDCHIELMGQLGGPGVKHNAMPYMISTDAAGSSMVINHSKGTSWTGSSFLTNQFSCMRYTKKKCRVSSGPSKPEGGRKPQNQGAIWIEFSAPPQKIEAEIDLDNLFLNGELEQTSHNSRENFTVTMKYDIGLMKEIDVILEPEDDRELAWRPSPGETRNYTLTFNEPGPEEVEKVRFILHSTSKHPGIATNAGNHLRNDQCEDCKPGKKPEKRLWETFMGYNAKGEPLPVYRIYNQYNNCPIDSLPDLFFKDQENPDFEMGDAAISDELNYTISQEITSCEKIDEKTCTAVISVMDSAASARLSAEILWGGVWYEAKAIGQTANEAGTRLLIPLDRDHNSLPDHWETDNNVNNPDEDNDNTPPGDFRGDGLTNFEEYRGIYSEGVLTRLCPNDKDLFVFDDSTRYHAALHEVQKQYESQNLTLWILEEDEFRDDLINYNEVEHRGGDQYIIVILGYNAVPQVSMEDASGLAAHAGPPTRMANTIIIDTGQPDLTWVGKSPYQTTLADLLGSEKVTGYYASHYAQVLGHEIGHLQSLPHHGEGEGYRTIKNERGWVACIGGQHSGNRDCFMKYNNATWFINLDFVPQTSLGQILSSEELVPYPDAKGAKNYFCNSKTGNGCCKDAAEGGNCLKLLNGRSF